MSTNEIDQDRSSCSTLGALALGGLRIDTGIAYADPGHGQGDWDGPDRPGDWPRPYLGPPQACVNAAGQFGYVS